MSGEIWLFIEENIKQILMLLFSVWVYFWNCWSLRKKRWSKNTSTTFCLSRFSATDASFLQARLVEANGKSCSAWSRQSKDGSVIRGENLACSLTTESTGEYSSQNRESKVDGCDLVACYGFLPRSYRSSLVLRRLHRVDSYITWLKRSISHHLWWSFSLKLRTVLFVDLLTCFFCCFIQFELFFWHLIKFFFYITVTLV